MKTINQVFTAKDFKMAGRWALWVNDTELKLAKLTIRPRVKIKVEEG